MWYSYILVIALYSFSNCLASEPLVEGIQTAINTLATNIPQGLVPLNQYDLHREYDEIKINSPLITEFLNHELKSRCIDPTKVTYLIGAEGQDWEFIKLSGGYGLIIPESTASVTNFAQRLLGLTQEMEPEYALNIKRLSDLLSEQASQEKNLKLSQYKLAIVKALVKKTSEDGSNLLLTACLAGAVAHAVAFSPAVSQGLANTLSALSYVYHLLPAHNKWTKFQEDLDAYILESSDIDLILAHIKDLEQQLEVSRSSYIVKLMSYLPIAANNSLEQRIRIIKGYVAENQKELTAVKSFRSSTK